MSKIDRRIAKSREAIKNAVTELMPEKNFDEITIQDIADRAIVNRGTIYVHYILQFFGSAIVGAVEWWFKKGMPLPARVMAEQTGALLDRNL